MSSHCNRATRRSARRCMRGARARRGDRTPRRRCRCVRVCVDEASPTASLDERVARAAMATQGHEIRSVPFTGYGKGGDGFPAAPLRQAGAIRLRAHHGFPARSQHAKSDRRMSKPRPPTRARDSCWSSAASAARQPIAAAAERQRSGHRRARHLRRTALRHASQHRHACLREGLADARGSHGTPHRRGSRLADRSSKRTRPSHPRSRSLALQALSEKHMAWNLVALYASESQGSRQYIQPGSVRAPGARATRSAHQTLSQGRAARHGRRLDRRARRIPARPSPGTRLRER